MSGRAAVLTSGVGFGAAAAAFVDEVVFHQLLGWHHFYDLSTTEVGLLSDGILHAFSWFATVAALFLWADLRRAGRLDHRRWAAGVLVGYGTFQLYDGLVQHKLLRLHQIRYDVELLPYDLVWNLSAAAVLLVGLVLLRAPRVRRA